MGLDDRLPSDRGYAMMTTIRERPVILTAAEVTAALAGTLGVIERAVRLFSNSADYSRFDDDGWPLSKDSRGVWHRDLCPFGEPGMVLTCKETWWSDRRDSGVVIYDATPEWGKYQNEATPIRSTCPDGHRPTREECRQAMLPKFWVKRGSWTMSKWAVRIRLENLAVSVVRVDGEWRWRVEVRRVDGDGRAAP